MFNIKNSIERLENSKTQQFLSYGYIFNELIKLSFHLLNLYLIEYELYIKKKNISSWESVVCYQSMAGKQVLHYHCIVPHKEYLHPIYPMNQSSFSTITGKTVHYIFNKEIIGAGSRLSYLGQNIK